MNYYPLVRGRQADLLALLAALDSGLSPKVRPIIEPVKDNATLPKVILAFAQAHHPLYVVANPQVGHYALLQSPRHPLPAPLPAPIQAARFFDAQVAPLVITTTMAEAQVIPKTQLAVLPDEARVRALRHPQAIYSADHTPWRPRTEDYHTVPAELYQYPKAVLPGVGFSDYPLSRAHYDERGGPQRAVALHLLAPHADGTLWLHHFTSVNHADYTQPAAKFFEALRALEAWLATHPKAQTPATAALLALGERHHFPGLGALRKLQLWHFFTVMAHYLD